MAKTKKTERHSEAIKWWIDTGCPQVESEGGDNSNITEDVVSNMLNGPDKSEFIKLATDLLSIKKNQIDELPIPSFLHKLKKLYKKSVEQPAGVRQYDGDKSSSPKKRSESSSEKHAASSAKQAGSPKKKDRKQSKKSPSKPTPTKSKAVLAAALEDKHCSKLNAEVHPTMLLITLPLKKTTTKQGEEVIEVHIPPVNHNPHNHTTSSEITNNIYCDIMNVKNRKVPSFSRDMELFAMFDDKVRLFQTMLLTPLTEKWTTIYFGPVGNNRACRRNFSSFEKFPHIQQRYACGTLLHRCIDQEYWINFSSFEKFHQVLVHIA